MKTRTLYGFSQIKRFVFLHYHTPSQRKQKVSGRLPDGGQGSPAAIKMKHVIIHIVFIIYNYNVFGQRDSLMPKWFMGSHYTFGQTFNWQSPDYRVRGDGDPPIRTLFHSFKLSGKYVINKKWVIGIDMLLSRESIAHVFPTIWGSTPPRIPKYVNLLSFDHTDNYLECNINPRIVLNRNQTKFTYIEVGMITSFNRSEIVDYHYLRYDTSGQAIGRYVVKEKNTSFYIRRMLLSFSMGRELAISDSRFYFNFSGSLFATPFYRSSKHIENLINSRWGLNAGFCYRTG